MDRKARLSDNRIIVSASQRRYLLVRNDPANKPEIVKRSDSLQEIWRQYRYYRDRSHRYLEVVDLVANKV